MARYPHKVVIPFGQAYTGQTGNVGYTVTDDQGVVRIARTTTGVVEQPAGSGVYVATIMLDDGWRSVDFYYDITGVPGVVAVDTYDSPITGLVQLGFTRALVALLNYMRQFVPGAAKAGSVAGQTFPPVVPDDDIDIPTQYSGLPAGLTIQNAKLEVRLGGALIPGVPDRTVTTTTDPEVVGVLNDPGSVASDGTTSVTVTFHFTAAETGHLTPGTSPTYNVTALDNNNNTRTLEIGKWPVVQGGQAG